DTETAERAFSERPGGVRLAPLAMLRHIQAVSALERAVLLNPDLEEAHRLLADMYGELNFLDASLEHRREEYRLRRAAGRVVHQDTGRVARDLGDLADLIDQLDRRVQDARNKLLTQPRLVDNPFDQANLAL